MNNKMIKVQPMLFLQYCILGTEKKKINTLNVRIDAKIIHEIGTG